MITERMARIRALRLATGAPVAECAQALDASGGELPEAIERIRHSPLRPRDTGDPFLRCKLGSGIGVDHRGKLYHYGCPAAHGGPR